MIVNMNENTFKKMILVSANLLLGNLILLSTSKFKLTGSVPFFMTYFSISATFLLFFVFKLLKPHLSVTKIMLISILFSFAVPIIGLGLAFLNPNSLNGSVVGAAIGFLAGVMAWRFTLPMVVVNFLLFFWISKK